MFSDCVPAKPKLPFQAWALLFPTVIAAAVALSNVPPVIVSVLAVPPRAFTACCFSSA
jgi:hypothetical protein